MFTEGLCNNNVKVIASYDSKPKQSVVNIKPKSIIALPNVFEASQKSDQVQSSKKMIAQNKIMLANLQKEMFG